MICDQPYTVTSTRVSRSKLRNSDRVEPAGEQLRELRLLGFSDCGEIESVAPLGALEQLEELYAWGSTWIVDGDLSPLARLPRLKEIRMRDRRGYKPRGADLVSGL